MSGQKYVPVFNDSRRLETFSEGVFVVLITLLALDVERVSTSLRNKLLPDFRPVNLRI